jgi:Sensors of blue-light using FAD
MPSGIAQDFPRMADGKGSDTNRCVASGSQTTEASNMPTLIHCIYSSAAAHTVEATDLANLLEKARENNQRLGLTGMLLYAEGSFFQVLEGQAEVVDALYARIESDKRHTQVTKIIREPIPQRFFTEWTMGFSRVSREDLAGISGTNDFFAKGRCFAGLDCGRAKQLLEAFREGHWRRKLSGARQRAGA